MKKNDIFTFTAPNGVEVTAVIISTSKDCSCVEQGLGILSKTEHICYAQNRIFTYYEDVYYPPFGEDSTPTSSFRYGEVIVEYAILPDYDDYMNNPSEGFMAP